MPDAFLTLAPVEFISHPPVADGGAESVVVLTRNSPTLTGTEFLDLWKPEEVATAMSTDPVLMFNALRAISMNSVNLSSANLLALLDRAVAKGVLLRARADQIAAGISPT